MILQKVNLDYNNIVNSLSALTSKLWTIPLAKKNTQDPRAIDGLYRRYKNCAQSGHQILDLRTNKIISRQRVQTIPIITSVMDLVHALAKKDNMPSSLKIATRTGNNLYDYTLFAGVDYTPPKASKTNVKRRNTKRQPFIDEDSDTEEEPLNEEVYDTEDES
jgi:hypothetical protein